MRVGIVGANGQLGTDLVEAYLDAGHSVVSWTHDDFDVAVLAEVEEGLSQDPVDLVVNTAAFHNVDLCEDEPEQAFATNAIGVRNLARMVEAREARLLHISTDYVFDGAKGEPYKEEDLPGPLNAYGVTKLAGEHFAASTCERHLIVRTSAIFGTNPCRAKGGRNFVELMLHLARERGEVRVVDDETVTPTYTRPLARQIVLLSERNDLSGLFHATSQGSCTWHEFAEAIFAEAGVEVELHRATKGDFPSTAVRPAYSVMDNSRLQLERLDQMPHWLDSLKEYLNDVAHADAEEIQIQ